MAAGAVRPPIHPDDLLMSLGGVTLIADPERQRGLAGRLIELLLTGVPT